MQDGLIAGAVVMVKDLPATELNGMQGKLLSYSKLTQRWEVQITNKNHPFSLFAENLQLVSSNTSQGTSAAQKRAEVSAGANKKRKEVLALQRGKSSSKKSSNRSNNCKV
jgi:hypothetical protein